MSVENSNSVDGMGISKADGKVVLTIADHLDWSDEQHHFKLIERKIGSYVGFINSGQLEEVLPAAKGCPVRIELIYQYKPSELGSRFLNAAKQQLKSMNVELAFGALPPQY